MTPPRQSVQSLPNRDFRSGPNFPCAIEQRTIQAALLVSFGDLPHCLGRKPEADSHRRGGLSILHLPQRQGSQYGTHRLQTAAQQLIQSMAITPRKLQTQSSAHALVIRPNTTHAKYLF
jgi:hypothetical protein